ncbi:hypothetical protein QBC45DRAFT_419513 [Copromyces sp. CBS 386.78]|nr:hypothetical protein QBC45DRAFT_419513 [Copromyces sp. CBS 386.78]
MNLTPPLTLILNIGPLNISCLSLSFPTWHIHTPELRIPYLPMSQQHTLHDTTRKMIGFTAILTIALTASRTTLIGRNKRLLFN